MLQAYDISEIIDSSVKDISKRVAKIDVFVEKGEAFGNFEKPYTIFSTTSGDYQMMLSFCTDKSVLRAIAENMTHGRQPLDEEEVLVYTSEYFNILCGHVISAINKEFYLKTYFSVPTVIKGDGICCPDSHFVQYQKLYNYYYGSAKIEALQL